MKRRLFTLLSAMSLVLAFVVVFYWIQSYTDALLRLFPIGRLRLREQAFLLLC